jgi:hypothetical protein
MKRSIAPLALLILSLAPATAAAAVRCVPVATTGCTTGHATVNAAVTAASNDDTIRIAAGTYAEAVNTPKRLTFVGAGGGTLESSAGATTIAPPSSGPAISLAGGGTVRSLRAVGATGFIGGAGIAVWPTVNGSYEYVVDDVVAIGGVGTDITIGSGGAGLAAVSQDAGKVVDLAVTGSELKGGSATMPIAGNSLTGSGPGLTATVERSRIVGADLTAATAVSFGGGMTGTIADSSVRSSIAALLADGTFTLRRSRFEATGGMGHGVTVTDHTPGPGTQATIVDSLLVSTPSFDTSPVYPLHVNASDFGGAAAADVRGSTLVARGAEPDAAVAASRQSASSPAVTVDLRNSVARLTEPPEFGEGDVFSDRAVVTVASSSFSSRAMANGGTVTPPGTGANVAGNPQLDAAFAPLPSSPLIDRGDPALVAPGQLDLVGRARSLDGTGDCVARPDIGAFELASRCPVAVPALVAPELSQVSLQRKRFTSRKPRHEGRRRGTTFRFTLSEDAEVTIAFQRKAPGRRVTIDGKRRCVKPTRKNRAKPSCPRWVKAGGKTVAGKAGSNSIPFSGSLRGRPLKAGSYRATLTAKDGGGLKSSPKHVAFRILRP